MFCSDEDRKKRYLDHRSKNEPANQGTSLLFTIVWVCEINGHQFPWIAHETLLCVPAIPVAGVRDHRPLNPKPQTGPFHGVPRLFFWSDGGGARVPRVSFAGVCRIGDRWNQWSSETPVHFASMMGMNMVIMYGVLSSSSPNSP